MVDLPESRTPGPQLHSLFIYWRSHTEAVASGRIATCLWDERGVAGTRTSKSRINGPDAGSL